MWNNAVYNSAYHDSVFAKILIAMEAMLFVTYCRIIRYNDGGVDVTIDRTFRFVFDLA